MEFVLYLLLGACAGLPAVGPDYAAPQPGVRTLQCRAADVASTLATVAIQPTFISAYVSPHVDIEPVARAVTGRFPGVPVMLCSTAGELCSQDQTLYCATGNSSRALMPSDLK